MTFGIHIYQRNVWTEMIFPGLEFAVERMGWTAQGGCDMARINVTSNRLDTTQRSLRTLQRNNVELLDVWQMLELLRCPVIITDERDFPVWWGYVERADVWDGKVKIGVSLEKMANRVKVVYTQVNTAGTVGERADTDWAQNDVSISEYGTKEKKTTLNQGTSAQAEQKRDTLLDRLKYPLPVRSFGEWSEPKASLTLAGWIYSLEWELYEDSSGKEAYETIGDGLQAFGNATASTAAGQSFQLATSVGWEANVIRVRMKKEGAPTDNVIVKLRSDTAGAPGTNLATCTIAASAISENLNWHEFELSARVTLSASTTYWVSIERSGAVDASNYYKVDGNEDVGYSRGVFRLYTGATWVARSPEIDMLFSVSGVVETSEQVESIATTSGQFLSSISVQVASGVYSSPYREGDRNALAEMIDLLESGTTNDRRMLARVEADRTLTIKEEPAPGGTDDYLMDSEAKVYDWGGGEIEPWRIPVGVWARLKTVVPEGLNTTYLADPTSVFIERVEYNALTNKARITERDTARMLEIE